MNEWARAQNPLSGVVSGSDPETAGITSAAPDGRAAGKLPVVARLLVFLSCFVIAVAAQVAHPFGGGGAQKLGARLPNGLSHRVHFFEQASRDSEVDLFAHVVVCSVFLKRPRL